MSKNTNNTNTNNTNSNATRKINNDTRSTTQPSRPPSSIQAPIKKN